MVGLMRTMLGEYNIRSKKKWLDRCRLWRLVILQRPDGSFDICDDLAQALLSKEGVASGVKKPPHPLLHKAMVCAPRCVAHPPSRCACILRIPRSIPHLADCGHSAPPLGLVPIQCAHLFQLLNIPVLLLP